MSVVHLHTYSAYSLLSGTMTPQTIVSEVKKKGYRAVALTDRNVLYGVVPFYKACVAQNIQPIIGLTADILVSEEKEVSYPLILLAKNWEGYQNLMKISSAIQTKSRQGIPLKWLRAYHRGLFAISPGIEGEIEGLILNGELEAAVEKAKYYQQLFEPNSFFLSIQPFPTREHHRLMENILQINQNFNIPVVATNKAMFANPEDYPAWKAIIAIRENVQLDDLQEDKLEREYYVKSADTIKTFFQNHQAVLQSTIDIAAQCHVELPFHQQLLPKYPLKNQSSDDYLAQLCWQGLEERVPQPTDVYKERLTYELETIKKMHYSDYFLIVWDYVKFAKENGITVGPGRGSAAGSLVAYCLNITDVDPIKFHLLFERFLNPERVSMPDIDIDFPDHRRDEVIEYVAEKYGKNHVAQIITFGTFAAKAAIRDAARVYGLTNKEINQLSKSIPNKLGISLADARKESKELQKLTQHEKIKTIFEIACKIEGLPRHTSTHAAGVVISDAPLIEQIPLQTGSGEVLLTQFPMGTLEEIGLLKMDFLGLRNLSLIEAILKSIHYKENRRINLQAIPINDERTFALLQAGKTTGIFQLESDGMRNVLVQLKPTNFEDIVAVNALYRPGPMANIPTFIRRKHGVETVVYPHPDLKEILQPTYGVIVYQEQIMQIASKMAGFSLGEADLLRRAVSKKKRHILDQERHHFVEGAKKKGYDEQVAHNIYDLIVRFADYGFPRGHAVAYSMLAYQLAYLKAHFPLHFMACLLTSVIGNEDKITSYARELRHLGFTLKPPSINKSSYRFEVENNRIRFSLAAIKGVGIQALKEIMTARKERPFHDLFDFCLRVSLKVVNRKTIEHLIYAGSFDEFGKDRATLLATLDVAIEHAQLMKPDDYQMDIQFFQSLGIQPKYVEVEPMPLDLKLQNEKQVLGMFISEHPVSINREIFQLHGAIFIDEIEKEKQTVKIAAYIQEERRIRTKNGEAMAFLQISDETDEISAVVFPDVYKKSMVFLKKGETVFLTGYMERRKGNKQFVIREAEHVEELKKRTGNHRLFIKITVERQAQERLVELDQILKKNNGNTPVILYFEKTKKTVRLQSNQWIDPNNKVIEAIRALFGTSNVVLK